MAGAGEEEKEGREKEGREKEEGTEQKEGTEEEEEGNGGNGKEDDIFSPVAVFGLVQPVARLAVLCVLVHLGGPHLAKNTATSG